MGNLEWLSLVWIGGWIVASIFYRQTNDKPVIPRSPSNATFKESWISGRSLKNILTRIGGARNCLLVYVADGTLTIVPCFPFNLMFLPEIYGLEISAPVSTVTATDVDGLLRNRVLVTVEGAKPARFELWVRDRLAFRSALGSA